MSELLIGGIPASAPVWRGCPQDTLNEIILELSAASYHYADDSGKEVNLARQCLARAAKLCNQWKLGITGLRSLWSDSPQLVTFNQFVDAVLKDARDANF